MVSRQIGVLRTITITLDVLVTDETLASDKGIVEWLGTAIDGDQDDLGIWPIRIIVDSKASDLG